MKFYLSLFCVVFGLIFVSVASAQNCAGSKIFSQTACAGDEVSAAEIKLQQLINAYRAENKLPAVPISKSLSVVANRHLLDLQANFKDLTHSWSDCQYDLKNQQTWHCVTDAPERLKVGYEGGGYENLFRSSGGGSSAPENILAAWKKSPLHNSLILNLNSWRDKKWEAVGVAVRGNYAAIWFGSDQSREKLANVIQNRGLGVSYREMVKNLSNVVNIQRTASLNDREIWRGVTKDKSAALELVGTPDEIENAGISIKINLSDNRSISPENRKFLDIFLSNIFANPGDCQTWLDKKIGKLSAGAEDTLVKEGKQLIVEIDRTNHLIVKAKSNKKTSASEEF